MASSQQLAHRVSHDSDSGDSDAPEQLTLSSAKKSSQTRVEAVRAFEREMKAKRKRERKEREEERRRVEEERREAGEEEGGGRKRKRARGNVGRGKEVNGEKSIEMENVKRRMERAMRDAEAEEDGDDDEDDEDEDGSEEEDVDEDESEAGESSDNTEEAWGGITEEDATKPPSAKTKHLPDHIFSVAAAAAHTARSTSKQAPKSTPSSSQKHKDKRKKSKAKDILVGSRAIRMVPFSPPSTTSHSSLTTSLTLPPARIKKFLKRTLNLKQNNITSNDTSPQKKNQKSKAKSWERRPVQLGVMRHTTGPAMRFVRNGNAAGH